MVICKKCKYCTKMDEGGYYCFVSNEWIPAKYANDDTLGCDAFVEELDDNEAP